MAKTVTIVGNVHFEPVNSGIGSSGDFDLASTGLVLTKVSQDTFDLDATEGSPYAVVIGLPAKLLGVRVLSGGPVELIVTSANGTDQKFPVAGRLLLVTPTEPLTAVKLAGTATIDLLVGG